MKVLKHEGTVPPAPSNTFVISIPPSKKSGGTTVCPTPSVASEVSHGVETVEFQGLLHGLVVSVQLAFVVAQSVSVLPVPWLLQSWPLPIGFPLQPFSAGTTPGAFEPGSGQSCESMQPLSPGKAAFAAHWKALMVLTPPP